jgi:predicted nuclease of predicted toxin-antitoxin system
VKLLIDMNLSPDWVDVFEEQGWAAIHWTTVGNPRAPDRVIMDWAHANSHVVFTHDLDFGTLLATTRAQGPSVIQVRTQDVMPWSLGDRLVKLLGEFEPVLDSGALITVDEIRSRVRILLIN